MTNAKNLLLPAFQMALAAADPVRIVSAHLPTPPKGRTLVVGGGKAAAAMAKAVETDWPRDSRLSGLVVTRYQHGLPLDRIQVVEASHPLPDGRGAEAAGRMLEDIQALTADDLLLVLISGGGSSLLALPVEGVTLKDLRAVTKALLASGATIREINTVRKHLTRFSGGQVAVASKAPVLALILSDVVGDDPKPLGQGLSKAFAQRILPDVPAHQPTAGLRVPEPSIGAPTQTENPEGIAQQDPHRGLSRDPVSRRRIGELFVHPSHEA